MTEKKNCRITAMRYKNMLNLNVRIRVASVRSQGKEMGFYEYKFKALHGIVVDANANHQFMHNS